MLIHWIAAAAATAGVGVGGGEARVIAPEGKAAAISCAAGWIPFAMAPGDAAGVQLTLSTGERRVLHRAIAVCLPVDDKGAQGKTLIKVLRDASVPAPKASEATSAR